MRVTFRRLPSRLVQRSEFKALASSLELEQFQWVGRAAAANQRNDSCRPRRRGKSEYLFSIACQSGPVLAYEQLTHELGERHESYVQLHTAR